jgi:hypothetical protein
MPSNSDYPYYQEYKQLVKSHFNIDITTTNDWTFLISSKRILFQLINSLKVFLNKENIEDYDFKALVKIESLKIIYPKLYNFIIENSDSVLSKYNSIGSVNVYTDGRGSHENTYQSMMNEITNKSNNQYSTLLLEGFFSALDKKQEYRIRREEFLKYFKYSLQNEEFSSATLIEVISNKDKELLYGKITENNKDSLFKKINEILESDSANDWLLILFIELIYKERKYLWLYNKKYNINNYKSYLTIEDLRSKIANLSLKDKIVFLTDLENKDDKVTHYLIDLFSDYFERKIDDLFWLVYHSLNDAKHQLTNSPINRYFNIVKSTISENFMDVVKVAISLFKDGKGGQRINHSDPANYYLIGLFSKQDWINLIPNDKNDVPPYSDIRYWLDNLDSNSCRLLNYTQVFGKGYFDRDRGNKEPNLEEE